MDLSAIISPVLAIGGMGLIFGVGLGIAAKKFAVPVDERVEAVKAYLPGANCGGCGLAGCEAMAKSIVSGESKVNGCPVCSSEQVEAIAKVMGTEADSSEKQIAVVRCKGSTLHAKIKYKYEGIQTCQDAQLVGGGPKSCSYGCLGFGSCQSACPFEAITLEDGLPVIHPEQCVGCGICASTCPRHIIHILPIDTSYHVNCISEDKGKEVKAACEVGCMGCGLCMKQCEVGAITLSKQCAVIDNNLCIGCGKCMAKCPTQAISNLLNPSIKQDIKKSSVIADQLGITL